MIVRYILQRGYCISCLEHGMSTSPSKGFNLFQPVYNDQELSEDAIMTSSMNILRYQKS